LQAFKEEVLERTIDLGKYAHGQQLQEIGPEMIKQELQRMGIKCGGSLEERANRLFSTKGITTKEHIRKKHAKNSYHMVCHHTLSKHGIISYQKNISYPPVLFHTYNCHFIP
jgi:hypothetical protein